jgi:hypothetical protein
MLLTYKDILQYVYSVNHTETIMKICRKISVFRWDGIPAERLLTLIYPSVCKHKPRFITNYRQVSVTRRWDPASCWCLLLSAYKSNGFNGSKKMEIIWPHCANSAKFSNGSLAISLLWLHRALCGWDMNIH